MLKWMLLIFLIVAALPLSPTIAETAELGTDHLEIGATYRCAGSTPDRDVFVRVGQLERATDDLTVASVALASAAAPTDTPVGHAPMDVRQLTNCVRDDSAQFSADEALFWSGYTAWKAAFQAGKAGAWTHSPSEVYWMIVEAAKS
jgi:hypothetical protein